MATDFLTQVQRWRATFAGKTLSFFWKDGRLENGYCVDCRFCCGPQPEGDEPYPMPLLAAQQREGLEDDFFLLAPHVACLDQRGCKSLTPAGCRLPKAWRPPTCGLFPLVILPDGRLAMYQICPAVLFSSVDTLVRLGEEAAQELQQRYTKEELQTLAVPLAAETIAQKCLVLGMRVYER